MRLLSLSLIVLLAACGSPSSASAPPVTDTPLPTIATEEPTEEPTEAVTEQPTDTPPQAYTLSDVDDAVATRDCLTILDALGDEDRIAATDDIEVLTAALTALGRCETGSYVDDPVLVPLGESARAGDWIVRVTGKVNFDAWPVVKRENMFNDPAPRGWKMVMIPLSFKNVGSVKAALLGTGEYVYGEGTLIERSDFDDPTCGVIPNELDFFTDVRPGGTLKGNMCFVVENSDIKTLRFVVPADPYGFSDEPDVEFALR